MTDSYEYLTRLNPSPREQRHQRRVRFDPVRRVIDVTSYSLHLDEARNGVALLDWLLQIAMKGWCSPQLLHDLVWELEDACEGVFGKNLQGVYCPWGEPRVVDWSQGTTRAARLQAGNMTKRQPREAR